MFHKKYGPGAVFDSEAIPNYSHTTSRHHPAGFPHSTAGLPVMT